MGSILKSRNLPENVFEYFPSMLRVFPLLRIKEILVSIPCAVAVALRG